MKIGRLSLELGGTPIVVEDIEIESIEDLRNLAETIIKESKFASPSCYYEKVCTDFPTKCAECMHRPKKSYLSKGVIARVAGPKSATVKTT